MNTAHLAKIRIKTANTQVKKQQSFLPYPQFIKKQTKHPISNNKTNSYTTKPKLKQKKLSIFYDFFGQNSSFILFSTIFSMLGLGALILVASYIGINYSLLIGSLGGLFGGGVWLYYKQKQFEIEKNKIISNYERLIRDTAKNRQEILDIKQKLTDTGLSAKRVQMIASMSSTAKNSKIDIRILDSIIDSLAKIDEDKKIDDDFIVKNPKMSKPNLIVNNKDKYIEYSHSLENVDNDLSNISNDKLLHYVSEALRNDKIDLFVQPIVSLPQRKRRFYEMYSRIRIEKNKHIPAELYIEIARKNNMLAEVDNLLLLRGLTLIQTADAANLNRSFFCNITPATLNDNKFMGDLLEFITQYRILAPKIIFELNQLDMDRIDSDILAILDGLSKLGCRFSMDRVKKLEFNFNRLDSCHIRFIKISAKLLGRKLDKIGGFSELKRIKDDLSYNGIDLIVDKIETEEQLVKLLDLEIDYGQGHLFGIPKEWIKKPISNV